MSDIDVFYMEKQPAERRTRTVDFSAKVPTAATISTATIAMIDAETSKLDNSMLASTTGTISGGTVSFAMLGGVDGGEYKATVTATLSTGDILTADVLLSVRGY